VCEREIDRERECVREEECSRCGHEFWFTNEIEKRGK